MEEQKRKRLFDKNKAEEAEERLLGDCWQTKKHPESLYKFGTFIRHTVKTSLTGARANEDCMAYKRETKREN